MENELLTVSQFVDLVNQTLDFALPQVLIEGEVSSFKINQDRWVFFDIKDEQTTVGCFMPKYQLHTEIEDGMLIKVLASPSLTRWGKFSLTIKEIELAGEGDVKKAFEKLRAKFEAEGLFEPARKRLLPTYPKKVALITSAQAAAYNDFVTILEERWPKLEVDHIQVLVQGMGAPASITAALEYCNANHGQYDAVVVIRGGGSLEDLQVFNNELVVRAVYGSKVPTLVAIGHEDDVTLAELAADVRGATPTDAARRLVPDRIETLRHINHQESRLASAISGLIEKYKFMVKGLFRSSTELLTRLKTQIDFNSSKLISAANVIFTDSQIQIKNLGALLNSLSPELVLKRGYSITTINSKVITNAGQIKEGDAIMVKLWRGSVNFIANAKGIKKDD